MKQVNKLARHFASILLISLSLNGSVFAANELPQLGTVAASALSIDQENKLGDAYMRMLRGQLPLIHDPVMNEYLTDLGHRLVAHAQDVRTPFEFFLVNNSEINAFAFFGGHVGVHSGLFHYAESESEIASVLAHEIAHVTQRHLARALEAQQQTGAATVAGVIGSILLAMAAPEAGIAALQTTVAANAQSQINYTRSNEFEADRIGMRTLVAAGFDPYAAPSFFGKLAAQYRFASKPPAMLLTHPLPESRIAETRSRASQYPQRATTPSLSFHLAKVRAQVRYSQQGADYWHGHFEQQLKQKEYALKAAAEYGLALASLELKRYTQARSLLETLLKADRDNLFYLDVYTDVLLAQNQGKQAIEQLKQTQLTRPNNAVIEINLAHAYLKTAQPELARLILEEQLRHSKDSIVIYDLLIQTYQALHKIPERHMMQAELLALRNQYAQAIEQLQYAYQQSGDNTLQRARIDARIHQLREAELHTKQL